MRGGELFPQHLDPDWLPDETLFSLCSRIHRLSCNALSRDTTRQLFGHARYGVEHDFTCNVSAFVARSRGRWGAASDLVRNRTLLGFYLPFRSLELQSELKELLNRTGSATVKSKLGLPASRFRAHHPLKACPDCMQLDQSRYGVPYWHRAHQIPGVWICPEHGSALMECTSKTNGVRRLDWLLPDEVGFVPALASEPRRGEAGDLKVLSRFARTALRFLTLPDDFFLDPACLRETYRARALELEQSGRTGSLAWSKLAVSYASSNVPLRRSLEMVPLPNDPARAKTELQRLLRGQAGQTHPLRHLALIHWLFPDCDAFLSTYHQINRSMAAPAVESKAEQTLAGDSCRAGPKRTLVMLVTERGESIRSAASKLGIASVTAMAWLAQSGIAPTRRPKKLRPEIRIELINALVTGADKSSVALRFGLSDTTITSLLRTEPGLYEAWKAARRNEAREMRRTEWMQLFKGHRDAGLMALRALAPACYSWLYRNDRAWLETTNASAPQVKQGNYSDVDWVARDAALAAKVSRVALRLAMQDRSKRIKQWQLVQALPDLRAKLGQLKRLPQTRLALAAATAAPLSAADLLRDV